MRGRQWGRGLLCPRDENSGWQGQKHSAGGAEVLGPDLGYKIQGQLEPLEWDRQEGRGFWGHWDPSPKSAGSTWPLTFQAGLPVSS